MTRARVWNETERFSNAVVTRDSMSRRAALRSIVAGAFAAAVAPRDLLAAPPPFRLRWMLGSCMYGTTDVASILPEVAKIGAEHIDIWPRVHGNQREQVEAMGHDRFAALLAKHRVKLGMITQYKRGPFGLEPELPVAKTLGATLLITGARGPKGLEGGALKAACRRFATQMEPHVAAAEKHGLTIGIENHGGSLVSSPDSIRWFAEFAKSRHIGIALAPYHLPQDAGLLAKIIEDLGPKLVHFYAWQHGKGCMKKLPKEEELLQMPGRGPLDFAPLVAALRKIDYRGWTEIFMHPVPRGIPILPTTAEVTAEINRSRRYLEKVARG